MKKIIVVLLGVLLSGDVLASNLKSKQEISSLVKTQTGYNLNVPYDNKGNIENLLSKPLNEDNAVMISFINSPVIKSYLASLGISEAEMQEARLLRNPNISFSSRTSNEDGGKRKNEIEVKQDIFDILLWPLRQRIANDQFKVSELETAHLLTGFIKDVRMAYFEWLTTKHVQKLAADHFKAQEASFEIARRQKAAGNINALKMGETEALFQKAKIEMLKTKQETQMMTERLRTILGLKTDQFFMDETARIPNLPKENLVLSELEKKSLEHRLDLMIKRQEIKTLRRSKKLSGVGFLSDIEVGYSHERETSGHTLQGVVIEGPVPIFNRQQATHKGIQATIETAKYQLEAMERHALLDVRLSYQNVMTRRQIVEAYQEIKPVYQKNIKETLYHYNFMLTDVFHLLESKQAALENEKEYVIALKEYWSARIELENAIGAKVDYELVAP